MKEHSDGAEASADRRRDVELKLEWGVDGWEALPKVSLRGKKDVIDFIVGGFPKQFGNEMGR